jgi:hypothetical protein
VDCVDKPILTDICTSRIGIREVQFHEETHSEDDESECSTLDIFDHVEDKVNNEQDNLEEVVFDDVVKGTRSSRSVCSPVQYLKNLKDYLSNIIVFLIHLKMKIRSSI